LEFRTSRRTTSAVMPTTRLCRTYAKTRRPWEPTRMPGFFRGRRSGVRVPARPPFVSRVYASSESRACRLLVHREPAFPLRFLGGPKVGAHLPSPSRLSASRRIASAMPVVRFLSASRAKLPRCIAGAWADFGGPTWCGWRRNGDEMTPLSVLIATLIFGCQTN
jgi:hypothetical protein